MRAMALAAAFLVTAAHSFDLKGITLGESVDALRKAFPNLSCIDSPGTEGGSCEYRPTYNDQQAVSELNSLAGAETLSWHIEYDRGEVGAVMVSLESVRFEVVADALEAKFGKPNEARKYALNNLAGGPALQVELVWSSGTDMLMTRKYTSNFRHMTVALIGKRYGDLRRDREKAEARRRAKDL
jgi:hypothetical protein